MIGNRWKAGEIIMMTHRGYGLLNFLNPSSITNPMHIASWYDDSPVPEDYCSLYEPNVRYASYANGPPTKPGGEIHGSRYSSTAGWWMEPSQVQRSPRESNEGSARVIPAL